MSSSDQIDVDRAVKEPGARLTQLASVVRGYVVGGAGPIATAGAQFALALVLLHRLDAAAFGSFSFLLVASQLSLGVWGALFSAPLPALAAREGNEEDKRRVRRAMFAACLFWSITAGVVFGGIALAIGTGATAALAFAGASAVALLRWFARAWSYVERAPMRTLASDVVFGVVLLVGVAAMVTGWQATLVDVFCLMLAAAVLALAPFGLSYLVDQFVRVAPSDLSAYRAVWSDHARWSLLGVVTTELTANAHVYAVTLLYGPASFAAVAASALLIRPVTVVQNALGEFERPRMARDLADGGLAAVQRSARMFRLALIAAWLGTAVVAAALFALAPRLVFPEIYPLPMLITGTTLWLAVAFVRLTRTPESILLQAAGEFRSLALASVVSCGWSVVAVLVMAVATGPLWSIAGVLLGEAIFALWIWRQLRRWRAEFVAPVAG